MLASRLRTGPVPPFRVAIEFVGVEVDIPQRAGRIAGCLVVEMFRGRVAAFAARRNRHCLYARAECDGGDKTIAAVAVAFLDTRLRGTSDGGQRPPLRRGEGYRQAGRSVGEDRCDVVGEALDAVDGAPRRAPGAEIPYELLAGVGERLEHFCRRGIANHVVVGGCRAGVGALAGEAPEGFAPQHTKSGGSGDGRPTAVPTAQKRDLLAEGFAQRIVCLQVVVSVKEVGDQDVEARLARIIGGGDQSGQSEIVFFRQQRDGVQAAHVVAVGVHVARVVGLFGAGAAGGSVGPIVCVLDPAGGGVEQMGRFGEGVQTVPIGARVCTVDGPGVVEPVVAPGDELRVEIGDVAVGIGIDSVVGGVGLKLHHLHVGGVIARLGQAVGLLERGDWVEHHGFGDPMAVGGGGDDRAVMGLVGRKGFFAERT